MTAKREKTEKERGRDDSRERKMRGDEGGEGRKGEGERRRDECDGKERGIRNRRVTQRGLSSEFRSKERGVPTKYH